MVYFRCSYRPAFAAVLTGAATQLAQALGLMIMLASPASCASVKHNVAASEVRRAELDRRIAVMFDDGLLFKPHSNPDESMASKLAPLIIQQAASKQATSQDSLRPIQRNRFGTVEPGGVNVEHPAIYASESTIELDGNAHVQVTLAWCYPAADGGQGGPRVRGVRMTLNSAGAPVIWERLSDADGGRTRTFFVAESLEHAAATEYGPPLTGRRFSLERPLAATSEVLVARLVDDGPIPMGPMVYVEAETQEITTILCRCMAAQVRTIVENQNYELLPMENLLEALPVRSGAAHSQFNLKALLTPEAADDGLKSSLRLPGQF